jgi:putative transposase
MKKYNKQVSEANRSLTQSLDDLVREGARKLIHEALEDEVTEFLGRPWYDRHEDGQKKRYRNGKGRERKLHVGSGVLPIRVPRLREPFESRIVRHYQRRSDELNQLLPELYLHGLSTGDFQMCFQGVLGDDAPLSPNSISRLKQTWQEEYRQWSRQQLEREYLYVWADGVYPKAGPKSESMAVLVVVGLNRRGEKNILALHEGYRESAESWRSVLRDLRKRGVGWIGLVIADGNLGVWKALRDVFPTARRQRCFLHVMRNVLDKVPATRHDEVLERLRSLYGAASLTEAHRLVKEFRRDYGKLYPRAVASLYRAVRQLFTYMQFPKRHWRSIKTTNVIESIFASVKLRTDAARRIPSRESALYLVFKLLTTYQQRFRKINAYRLVPETIDLIKNKKYPKVRKAA